MIGGGELFMMITGAWWQLCKSTRKVSMRGYFLRCTSVWWSIDDDEMRFHYRARSFHFQWHENILRTKRVKVTERRKMALERGFPNRSRGSLCSPQRALVPMFEASRWWHEREVLRQMEGRTAIGYRKLFLQCLHPSSPPLFFTNDKVPLRSSSRIGNFEGTHLTYERRRTSHFGREPTH